MELLGAVEEFDQLRTHALGWVGLLDGLRHKLEELPFEINIGQVKEKFGGLRVYFDVDVKVSEQDLHRVREWVDSAENASYFLCYLCGAGVTHVGMGYWVRYFCKDHDTIDLLNALALRN